jgi:soluble lytic murein transglycosylase-like protein
MSAVTFIAASSKYLLRCLAFVAAALTSQAFLTDDALAAPYETASVAPGLKIIGEDGKPVQPLSASDTIRYRSIFALQRDAKWQEADRLIPALDNKLLLGHLLYQRYVHPKYKAAYPELVAWLKQFGDLPGAERIHRLATVRMPRGAKPPPDPTAVDFGDLAADAADPDDHDVVFPHNSTIGEVRRILSAEESVLLPVRQHELPRAEQVLDRLGQRRSITTDEYDDLRRQIAAAYYADGNDRRALALAGAAAQRSRATVPCADWTAGLAAWRLGDMAAAAKHFEALANSRSANSAEIGAGAFWASRANLRAHHPEKVNGLLGIAAQYPRSFYGLLASRQLSVDVVFNWNMPDSTRNRQRVEQLPGVQRALALSAAGQDLIAGQEIRQLYMHASDDIAAQLLALSSRLNAPAATMQLGQHWQASHGATFDGALYPVPHWRPNGGFTVDRALVFAFMRQESAFDTQAKSRAGAAGLMQLMPETASVMAQDRSLRDAKSERLYTPELNIDLGQRYLQRLLEADGIRGNLLLLAASYNAGPSTVKRWLAEIRYNRDPLLFIESIPAPETRNFVERVTANFWIYEERLGQDTPTLDTLAGGAWPYYVAEDSAALSVADDEPN